MLHIHYFLISFRHEVNKFFNVGHCYGIPLLLQFHKKVISISENFTTYAAFFFYVTFFHSSFYQPRRMLTIVMVLELPWYRHFVFSIWKYYCTKKITIDSGSCCICNTVNGTNFISRETSPHYYVSTAVFNCWRSISWIKFFGSRSLKI